jgi:hypothetical protein
MVHGRLRLTCRSHCGWRCRDWFLSRWHRVVQWFITSTVSGLVVCAVLGPLILQRRCGCGGLKIRSTHGRTAHLVRRLAGLLSHGRITLLRHVILQALLAHSITAVGAVWNCIAIHLFSIFQWCSEALLLGQLGSRTNVVQVIRLRRCAQGVLHDIVDIVV